MSSQHKLFLELNPIRIRRIAVERMIKDAVLISTGVYGRSYHHPRKEWLWEAGSPEF